MSTAKCYSAHISGLSVDIITVEVDISNGLNALSIVGLGDRAVEESRDRISAAIKNSGYASPKQKNQKVVISLAPADIRKEGPAFDLPMALSYLAAAGDIEIDPERTLFLGELSLQGDIRRVGAVLPILCYAQTRGFKKAFVPRDNAVEASLARGISICGVVSLKETLAILRGERPFETAFAPLSPSKHPYNGLDMSLIRGNEAAKRGLLIAASGGHNILMYGPPGTGKTMLAQSFPSILPPLTHEESVEVTSIHSAAHVLESGLITDPPFRAPHHTASYPAVVGGGAFPRPGEITLAHRGVLFLDEFPEFDRAVLEALRQPLEERSITISRAKGMVTFPADCILIASMNPCPCGKLRSGGCTCSTAVVAGYRRRVSGPIMDRFDIMINVNKIDYEKLSAKAFTAESSADMRRRVTRARSIQARRFEMHAVHRRYNSEMDAHDIERIIVMEEIARASLARAAQKLKLSGRAFHRVLKVARTIADLAEDEIIREPHVFEALCYRQNIDGSDSPLSCPPSGLSRDGNRTQLR